MRICLSSIHPKPLSGQIEGLVGLAKELARLGNQVELVTTFGDALAREERLALGERDGRLLVGKLGRIGGVLFNLIEKAKTADIIHLNLPTPAFSFLGDIVRRLVSVPVVVGFEAHLAELDRLLRTRHLREAPRFYLPRILVNNGLAARCTLHSAAHYVVSSQFQAIELAALGFPNDRISVLPNVVELDKLRASERGAARRQLGLPADKLVAYIGHYHHVKGVEVLVEAFGHVARERDDCRLVLAWSGLGDPRPIERAVAEQGVIDRTIHLGRIPIGTAISAIDVLVLPYRYTMGQNAHPELVLEAMTLGVPLVTTDLPLLRELLENERTALLTPEGDAVAVAAGIKRILEGETLASTMSAEQRSLMSGALNPREVAKCYEQLYRQLQAGEAPVLRQQSHQPGLRPPALRGTERGMGQPAGGGHRQVAAATPRENP